MKYCLSLSFLFHVAFFVLLYQKSGADFGYVSDSSRANSALQLSFAVSNESDVSENTQKPVEELQQPKPIVEEFLPQDRGEERIIEPQPNPSTLVRKTSLSQLAEAASKKSASTNSDQAHSNVADQQAGSLSKPGDFFRPRLVRAPKPEYPRNARRRGFEGTTTLLIQIAPDGEVVSAEVLKSSGRDDCDRAARDTVLNDWLFEPARDGALTVASQERVSIAFRLLA